MKYRGPGFYPPEGHDWVETEPIRNLAEHNAAVEDELYHHRLGMFRNRVFTIMRKHNAIDDGLGWIVFDDDCNQTATATGGTREVLLVCSASLFSRGDEVVPQVRLITNETYPSDEADSILTEDITVRATNYIRYHLDALTLPKNPASSGGGAVDRTQSPLFHVSDGRLSITTNAPSTTPRVKLEYAAKPELDIRPYGKDNDMVDNFYALNQADAILDSVVNQTPVHWYQAK